MIINFNVHFFINKKIYKNIKKSILTVYEFIYLLFYI